MQGIDRCTQARVVPCAGSPERVRDALAARRNDEHTTQLLALLARTAGRETLTLDQALATPTGSSDPVLPIRDGGRTRLVRHADIAWIEAAGDYMCVHAGHHTHVLRSTLAELLRQLDPHRFRRIHRSTIVNLDYVSELRTHPNGEAVLTLRGGEQLKAPPRHRASARCPSCPRRA